MQLHASTSYTAYKDLADRIEHETLTDQQMGDLHTKITNRFRAIEHSKLAQHWVQRGDLLDGIDALCAKSGGKLNRLGPLRQHSIEPIQTPLVRYEHIKNAAERLLPVKSRSLEEIQMALGPILESEPNANAKLINRSTDPTKSLFPLVTRATGRMVTSYLGSRYRSRLGKTIKKIAKFSNGMHITPTEVVGGKYWGPRRLFGQSLHKFRSVNDWFVRNLTDEARGHYTQGKGIIANSDCRLRISTIPQWQLSRRQRITGKALSQHTAVREGGYLTNDYPFTAKNLFGREDSDLMQPTVRNKRSIRWAQQELLAAYYRLLNSQGVHQVVQRLSPSDIHHYVAPADGTPLSPIKAAQQIKQLRPQETAHMDRLIEVFKKREKKLGHPLSVTIDIRGTLDSVAMQAIDNRPQILGQNDRKVMLYAHDDGGYSIHIFIGAIGVNQVNVEPEERSRKLGERLGDMQFGREKSRPDGVKKLRLGQHQGSFPVDGSTVISYYPSDRYDLIEPLELFRQRAIFEGKWGPTTIEVKCQMGDPILSMVGGAS